MAAGVHRQSLGENRAMQRDIQTPVDEFLQVLGKAAISDLTEAEQRISLEKNWWEQYLELIQVWE